MSSPCGFKTKHCQERSALAGQPAPCSAVLCCALHAAGDTILQVQDETYHHPFTLFCSLRLQTAVDSVCAAPIWAAAADLPARLERGPRHPGDWVHSHYPLWEKLLGGPGTGEREGRREGDGGYKEEQNKKKARMFAKCEERHRTWWETECVKDFWKNSCLSWEVLSCQCAGYGTENFRSQAHVKTHLFLRWKDWYQSQHQDTLKMRPQYLWDNRLYLAWSSHTKSVRQVSLFSKSQQEHE